MKDVDALERLVLDNPRNVIARKHVERLISAYRDALNEKDDEIHQLRLQRSTSQTRTVLSHDTSTDWSMLQRRQMM